MNNALISNGRRHLNRPTRADVIRNYNCESILRSILFCSEAVLYEELSLLSYRLTSVLRKNNMYRQGLKKSAKTINEGVQQLHRLCVSIDRDSIYNQGRDVFPGFTEQYFAAGGSVITRLQSSHNKKTANSLEVLLMSVKNIFDKMKNPHSDILSVAMIIHGIASSGVEVSKAVYTQRNNISLNLYRRELAEVRQTHHDTMVKASQQIIETFISKDLNLPEREAQQARQLMHNYRGTLAGEEMNRTVEQVSLAMQMEYAEFVIASIRMMIHDHNITDELKKNLLDRLGTEHNVETLLIAIAKLPLPEDMEDIDMIDYCNSLPALDKDNPVQRFREMCINGTVLRMQVDAMEKAREKEVAA